MICQELDGYMKHLCHSELMISWQITLTDGTIVYGDYEREGFDNPWIRLREYCEENDVSPAKVELYMFGAEHKIFFENQDGLDGISITRGVAKDQAMDGSYSKSYQTLTVCLLRNDCSAIDVAKYTWPHNEFEKPSSVRGLSTDNLTKMIFRNGSKKRNNPEVQKYFDGARM